MSDDVFSCEDGTSFVVQSELIRGEGRWFWVLHRPAREGQRLPEPGLEGSYDRRTARRRAKKAAAAWDADPKSCNQ